MTRRSGSTLIEVLVAMFVMGIGLIALLTLFPLGALLMAQAIRDSRCSEAAGNANSIAIAQNVRYDTLVKSIANDPDSGNIPLPDVFANPDPTKLPNADPYGDSYPVFVDPIGYNSVPSVAGSSWDWVGGFVGRSRLRRRPVSFTASKLDICQSFTLWDDINFNKTTHPGAPQKVANSIFRDARFSWAYLLRRPQTRDTSIVNCSVVVFESRSLALTGTLSLAEYVFGNPVSPEIVIFDLPTNTITMTMTSTTVPPPIRPGNWIYDATINTAATPPDIQSCFYRVVAADEIVDALGNSKIVYEVKQPIRPLRSNPAATAYSGVMIVMDGVVEVFEKGPARTP